MADSEVSLDRIRIVGAIILCGLTIGSMVFISFAFGMSVLAGGILSMGSFWFSGKDVIALVNKIGSHESYDARKAQAELSQKGYLLKFWVRIIIIGVILLLLIRGKVVNIFGLILGLSTVVGAIIFISMEVVFYYLFRGRR